MKVSERYTCYPSEFDCSDVVSKCVVITFYEFYITSTIILWRFFYELNKYSFQTELSCYYSGGVEKIKGKCFLIAFGNRVLEWWWLRTVVYETIKFPESLVVWRQPPCLDWLTNIVLCSWRIKPSTYILTVSFQIRNGVNMPLTSHDLTNLTKIFSEWIYQKHFSALLATLIPTSITMITINAL